MAQRATPNDRRLKLQQVLKLASQFPCDDAECKCSSYKRKQSGGDFSCGTCSHGLPRHGNLWVLSQEELDKLSETSTQIEYTTSQSRQASDTQTKKSHLERANSLKQYVTNYTRNNKKNKK